MHALDWILLAIVAVSVVTALIKGFVYEAVMLAATVIGVGLATWKYPALAARWSAIHSAAARDFLAWLAIFFAVFILAAILARLGRGLVKAAGLRWFDRLLGGALGLVRGAIICVVLLVLLTAFPFDLPLVRASRLAPDLLVAGDAFAFVLPGAMRRDFRSGLRRLRGASKPAVIVPPAAGAGTATL